MLTATKVYSCHILSTLNGYHVTHMEHATSSQQEKLSHQKEKFSHCVEIELETGALFQGNIGGQKRQSLSDLINAPQLFLTLLDATGSAHLLARSRIVRVSVAQPAPNLIADAMLEARTLLGVDADASYADIKSAYVRHSKRYDAAFMEEIGITGKELDEARQMTDRLKQAFVLLIRNAEEKAASASE